MADGYEHYMAMALDEAVNAYDAGEFPVGCVIVRDGHVIATGARKGTRSDRDRPSEIDHAEIRALRSLEDVPVGGLETATLFCTMEPCLMCFAAIVFSGIKTIVYAYEDAMGGGTGCDFSRMPPLYRDSGVVVVPGVLRQQSLVLFQKFFMKKDNRYWKGSLLERYTLDQSLSASVS